MSDERRKDAAERFRIDATSGKFTTDEALSALFAMGPAMMQSWQEVVGNSDLWQHRMDGPVYRRTPLLGRFRWYRRLRVWWLRRQLRAG